MLFTMSQLLQILLPFSLIWVISKYSTWKHKVKHTFARRKLLPPCNRLSIVSPSPLFPLSLLPRPQSRPSTREIVPQLLAEDDPPRRWSHCRPDWQCFCFYTLLLFFVFVFTKHKSNLCNIIVLTGFADSSYFFTFVFSLFWPDDSMSDH